MFTFKEKSISSAAAFRAARLHIKPGITAHHLHPSAVVLWWSSGSTRTAQPGSAYGTFPGGRRCRWNPPAAPLSSSPRPPAIRRPRTVTPGESANADGLEIIPPHPQKKKKSTGLHFPQETFCYFSLQPYNHVRWPKRRMDGEQNILRQSFHFNSIKMRNRQMQNLQFNPGFAEATIIIQEACRPLCFW